MAKNNQSTNHELLGAFLKKQVIKSSHKLKGSFLPLSEKVDNQQKTLKIKAIYQITDMSSRFYLLVVKNHSKPPNLRYFLLLSFASQSSDLLVRLAKDLVKKYDLKLAQYQLEKQIPRISLLCLKELKSKGEYGNSLDLLKKIRSIFRKRMDDLIALTE